MERRTTEVKMILRSTFVYAETRVRFFAPVLPRRQETDKRSALFPEPPHASKGEPKRPHMALVRAAPGAGPSPQDPRV